MLARALLFPPRAWRRKASAPSRAHLYDEDGMYLDSLSATGRGRRPAWLAWAVAPAIAGGITGIVARRSSSPTAPGGSSVNGVDMTEPLTDQLIKDPSA